MEVSVQAVRVPLQYPRYYFASCIMAQEMA